MKINRLPTCTHEQKPEHKSSFGQTEWEQCSACSDLHGSAEEQTINY